MIRGVALSLMLWPGAAVALTLDFPGNAVLVSEIVAPSASYDLPIGPWSEGSIATDRAEGERTTQVWQIPTPGVSTLQILAPLRQLLRREGFSVLLDCQNQTCGGFDFRFATDTADPPDMMIDLSDFRFLSARNDMTQESISLFISRSDARGFVQVIRIGPASGQKALATTTAPTLRSATTGAATGNTAPSDPAEFGATLDREGHVILTDLTFETGSAQLGDGPYGSLVALSDYLLANPGRSVALVGHTDASGALDANIALSKRRAASVLERLVTAFGVPRGQVEAQGMGYLAPIASNLSPEGRDLNRRVEVIVTSTE